MTTSMSPRRRIIAGFAAAFFATAFSIGANGTPSAFAADNSITATPSATPVATASPAPTPEVVAPPTATPEATLAPVAAVTPTATATASSVPLPAKQNPVASQPKVASGVSPPKAAVAAALPTSIPEVIVTSGCSGALFDNSAATEDYIVFFGDNPDIFSGMFVLLVGNPRVVNPGIADMYYTINRSGVDVAHSHIVIPDCTPATPTVTATADDTGTVTVKVTNTTDNSGATVIYEVTACDGTVKTVTVADGASGTVIFTDVPAGTCTITVSGEDGTEAATTVTVPPKPVDCTATPSAPQCTPATPTVTAQAKACVARGELKGGEIDGVVTNVADQTEKTVDYTVVVIDIQGIVRGSAQLTGVADGASAPFSIAGLEVGPYEVNVSGTDGTRTSTNVEVQQCSPAQPVVTAQETVCDLPGGLLPTGKIEGNVKNVADNTHQAVSYTVTLTDPDGVVVNTATLTGVADGASAPFEFDGLYATSYTVEAVGDDGTAAGKSVVDVTECTVAIPIGQNVTARSSACPIVGQVTFINPGPQAAEVLYGSFSQDGPDGMVEVAAGKSVVVKTKRSSLDWIAYAAESGLEDGMGEGLAVPQKCGVAKPPPGHKPPKAKPPFKPPVRVTPVVHVVPVSVATSPNNTGTLPMTGVNSSTAIKVASGLLASGLLLMIIGRRRRSSES